MDDRLRAESEARLFSAAASASKEDLFPSPPSSPHFSLPSPPPLYSALASPDLPEARIWEVDSVEAAEIEKDAARLRRGASPIQGYGWH
jgi:hypothetical protein